MNIPPPRILLALLALTAVSALAVERSVTITAPAEAGPGETVHVVVAARTDAGKGEHIGFLHADYSSDNGRKWASFCYLQNVASSAMQALDFPVGAAGSKCIIRVRVAFRDGQAGDVDFKGGPIKWNESWEKWLTPPTKFAIIYVN